MANLLSSATNKIQRYTVYLLFKMQRYIIYLFIYLTMSLQIDKVPDAVYTTLSS